MLNSVNLKHQKVIREWMDISDWHIPVAVTLTHKKSISGMRLTKYLASQNFRHFLSMLNKRAYRNASARHNKKVPVYAVLEGGLKRQRFLPEKHLHYHAVMDCPEGTTIEDFGELIKNLWLDTDWGDVQMSIKFFADQGAIDYMTKTRDKYSVTDAIDWVNVHKN